MGFLGILGNTTRSKFMALSSSRILSSAPAFAGTKACVVAPACYLDNLDSNRRMLMVQHVIHRTRDYSFISTGSFKVVKHNYLPNFSFLRVEDYYRFDLVRDYVVLSSCNIWIVLTSGICSTDPRDHLWNPKTNEMKTLPNFEAQPSVPRVLYARTRGYGIGFDPVSQDYKVIRSLVYEILGIGDEVHAELFSLATGSWKEIPYPHDPYIEPLLNDSLHINGFYYWLATHKDGSFCIISFDFANEKFPSALIPTPPSALIPQCTKNVKGRFDFELGEYYGSLAAVVYNSKETKPCFEIWVWNNDIDEWSCESAFDVPSAAAVPVDKIVGLCKNDKLLLQDSDGDLLLYDYVEEKLTNLGIRANMREVEVFPYMESSIYG